MVGGDLGFGLSRFVHLRMLNAFWCVCVCLSMSVCVSLCVCVCVCVRVRVRWRMVCVRVCTLLCCCLLPAVDAFTARKSIALLPSPINLKSNVFWRASTVLHDSFLVAGGKSLFLQICQNAIAASEQAMPLPRDSQLAAQEARAVHTADIHISEPMARTYGLMSGLAWPNLIAACPRN